MSSSRLPSAKASIRAAGEFAGRWRGQTVVCLASGPSLTADDVEAVRLSGHPAIVVNCTFRAAPWAQVLYGMDRSFWQHYLPEIERTFAGTRVGVHLMPARYRCAAMKGVAGFRPYNNSGAGAISLALSRALVLLNEKNRPLLRKLGLLTRDPRMVERKKYGHPKARKRFQFSKR